MLYEAAEIPRSIASGLYSSLIAPRPVVIIGTTDLSGHINLAPYSSLSLVATYPPMIAVSFGERKATKKDTLRNIEATGQLVVNLVSRWQANATVEAANSHSGDVDEYGRIGVTRAEFGTYRAGRIVESPASLGCDLVAVHSLAPSRCMLVIAQISTVFVNDLYLTTDNEFGARQANLFASIGAERYVGLEDAEEFTLRRTWE